MSLNNLSLRLYHMGLQEDAFQAIGEAVQLYQPLAADCLTAFNSSLQAIVEIRERVAAANANLF